MPNAQECRGGRHDGSANYFMVTSGIWRQANSRQTSPWWQRIMRHSHATTARSKKHYLKIPKIAIFHIDSRSAFYVGYLLVGVECLCKISWARIRVFFSESVRFSNFSSKNPGLNLPFSVRNLSYTESFFHIRPRFSLSSLPLSFFPSRRKIRGNNSIHVRHSSLFWTLAIVDNT